MKKNISISKYVVKFNCDKDLWSKICKYVFKIVNLRLEIQNPHFIYPVNNS